MAVIMSATVAEFFIFQLPLSVVVLMTIFQKLAGTLTMQNNMTALGYCLWFLDSIINPLWTTFLSTKTKRSRKNQIGNVKSTWLKSKGTTGTIGTEGTMSTNRNY